MPTIIATDTTWAVGQTIILVDDVHIAVGVRLTVEAGATVQGNGHSIVSFGTLSSVGTETTHSVFNEVDIKFGNSTPGRIEIDHAEINGGAFLPPTGSESYGSFALTNSVINGSDKSYIWHPTSDSVISGNVFLNSGGLSVGTHRGVQLSISDNAFINSTGAINGTATIVAWASYGDAVEVSGNSFLSSIPALEVTIDGRISGSQNYFGTTDLAAIDTLIIDRNDDLSRPSNIAFNPVASGPNELVTLSMIAAGDDVTQALAVRELFSGTSEGETLIGTSDADLIYGGGGNDTLNGGLGADTLLGEAGDDLIIFDSISIVHPRPTDIGLIDGGTGYDVLDLSRVSPTTLDTIQVADGSYSLGVYVGSQEFEIAGIETILLGSGGNTIRTSLAGSITIHAGSGDDRIRVNPRDGDVQNVYGDDGDDSYFISGVFGGTAGGILDGGAGANTLETNISFTVDLAAGTAVSGGASYSIAHFDTVVVAAWLGYISTVYGNAGNNSFSVNPLFNDGRAGVVFDGRAGNDTLAGGGGADTLNGGAGIDTLDYSASIAGVTVGLWNNSASGGDAQGDVISGFENVIGGAGNDTLTGNTGNNLLNGGTGADRMVGGTGNDSYVIDHAGDVIVENAGEGADHVDASISFALRDFGQHLETLTLTGTANIDGTGNGLNNVITGNSGNNVLNGAYGDDTLIGGAGNDTLRDESGADRMVGGTGNDSYVIDDAGDVIVENAGEGADHVDASISFALRDFGQHLETLTLTGTANIDGTGNGLNNVITGNFGNNVLNGAYGDDTLIGGAGNDTLRDESGADRMVGGTGNDSYVIDDAGDVIVENAGEGADHVDASISFALRDFGQHLETLTLTGTANIDGTGNGLNNVITGNSGNNVLNGAYGDDTLIGGARATTCCATKVVRTGWSGAPAMTVTSSMMRGMSLSRMPVRVPTTSMRRYPSLCATLASTSKRLR